MFPRFVGIDDGLTDLYLKLDISEEAPCCQDLPRGNGIHQHKAPHNPAAPAGAVHGRLARQLYKTESAVNPEFCRCIACRPFDQHILCDSHRLRT